MATHSRLLPGKSHGQRSLVGCSPWGCEESDTTERLHFHCSLSCIAEGTGNPLQCSRLENPKDGGAWWAAVHGVAQSRKRLKRLSSRSSSSRGGLAVFVFPLEKWSCINFVSCLRVFSSPFVKSPFRNLLSLFGLGFVWFSVYLLLTQYFFPFYPVLLNNTIDIRNKFLDQTVKEKYKFFLNDQVLLFWNK